jgi:uncharacterized membrane-anchored protein
MNKLRTALILLAVATIAGVTRLVLGDAQTDGLVLAILGAGAPGAWLLAVHIDERRHAE